jgi:hypothetical protein
MRKLAYFCREELHGFLINKLFFYNWKILIFQTLVTSILQTFIFFAIEKYWLVQTLGNIDFFQTLNIDFSTFFLQLKNID